MKQRIITGIVMIAIFLPTLIYGRVPFWGITVLLATIGLYELIKMKKLPLFSFSSIIGFLLLWLILLTGEYTNALLIPFDKMELVLIGLLLWLLYSVASKNRFTFDDAAFMLISVLYVGFGLFYLYEAREVGLGYVFFALLCIWTTDSGAYFVGRALGKNKLWPEISPNKTIEGFLGGIGCAIVVAVLFFAFDWIDFPMWELLLISIFISVFGQIGDLVQSAYKRHYGVKDSGTIFPGHGGVLDRLDSMIFIFPVLHLLRVISG